MLHKVLVKGLFVLLSFLFMAQTTWANLEDYSITTWNLQGSGASSENKWSVSIRQLITGEGAADILMVQEAGTLPATAVMTGRMVQPGGIPIHEYLWNLGSMSRPDNVYIYYSRVDVGANRVNLAIVSRRQAEEVIVIPPPTTVSRPIIGIRIGNDAFFTTHALANQGSDSPAIVNAVFEYFNQHQSQRNTNWIIAGDFNRSPTRLQSTLDPGVQRHVEILAPTAPTQQSGGTLDYAVVGNSGTFSGTALLASLLFGQVRSQLLSDHRPVGFFTP